MTQGLPSVTLESSPVEAALRAHTSEVGVARRVLLSLAATALGWLTAVAVSLVNVRGDASEWSRALRVWPLIVGLHVAPAWLFAVLPLALPAPADSPLLRRGWAALFGAGCGATLLFIALAGFWGLPIQKDAALLFAAAGACGAVTWESYGFLLRRPPEFTPRPSRSNSTP